MYQGSSRLPTSRAPPSPRGFIALAVTLLMVASSMTFVVPAGPHTAYTPDETARRVRERPSQVLHPRLARVMEAAGPREQIEAVVGFMDMDLATDRTRVEKLGLTWITRMEYFPQALIKGTAAQLLTLSQYQRVIWMEHNFQVQYMLDTTTMVIQATSAWNSRTIDVVDHEIKGALDQQSMATGIDGRGVTVAVVDTGVDAAHPDLDYGEKVLLNKWCDMEVQGECTWTEQENTDHSYGHGTHVAGTIAGNGDASAGERRGVAPGASLIEIGGDWTPFYWSVGAGLEWVFEHTLPGQNSYNIRAVSNSWGQGGSPDVYFPDDMLTLIIEALVYENDVVVVFAAGNDGGDGTTINTNPWSLIPASISVAATERDGSGITSFSSRGQSDIRASWPDVATPGHYIWATSARGTFIDALTKSQGDLYYLSISGTSMATPHMSGIVALMMQAAPSLTVSDVEEDHDANFQFPSHERARIHEAELILKLTSDFIAPTGSNLVPEGDWTGLDDRRLDYAQGYGLANASHAVALALTLQTLRDHYYSHATVWEAYQQYQKIMKMDHRQAITDRLGSSWRGEWSQLTDRSNPLEPIDYYTDQTHQLWIPEGTESADITLKYQAVDATTQTVDDVNLELDVDGDGSNDLPYVSDPTGSGTKQYHVDVTQTDTRWTFNTRGIGGAPFNPLDKFPEARAEYTVDVTLNLAEGANVTFDRFFTSAEYGHWEPAAPSQVTSTTVSILRPTYDLTEVERPPDHGGFPGEGLWNELRDNAFFWLFLLLAGAIGLALYRRPELVGELLSSDQGPEVLGSTTGSGSPSEAGTGRQGQVLEAEQ